MVMEDGPLKPSPAPVIKALEGLGIPHVHGRALPHVCMLGDTVDDMRSAVAAGIVGVGVLTPCMYPCTGAGRASPVRVV